MSNAARVIRCDSDLPEGTVRFLSDRLKLAEGQTQSVETLTRVVKFKDAFYGTVNITRKMLLSMVKNFRADVYGQKIFIDVAHMPSDGSAGEITRLFVEGNKLRAEIDWTEFGIEAVSKRGFSYFSAEFHENYENPETSKEHGPTLLGAGLTTRPRVKRLDPVSLKLSFDAEEGNQMVISNRVKTLLSQEIATMWKDLIKKLQEKLGTLKLAENIVNKLMAQFEQSVAGIPEKDQAMALMESYSTMGDDLVKQLADAGAGDGTGVTIQLSAPEPGGTVLSEDDVKRLLQEQRDADNELRKKLQQDRDNNVKAFNDALDAAEGLKSLSEDQLNELRSASDLITAEMTTDQVTALAENQIKLGNQLAVASNLSGLGYQGPSGNVHIQMGESNEISSLQESILTGLRGTSQHAGGQLVLAEQDKEHPFVTKVLGMFDQLNAGRLHQEHKLMAGGETGTGDTNLPVGFQRTVIREALSDFNVLSLIQTLTDPSATQTTDIPYETRDNSAIQNNGIVFEGQPIHRASVSQEMDLAYILPMKLALLVSNEVMHFTRASQIDWDAYGRNVTLNARTIRELLVKRIMNELQRAADAYLNTDITNEDLDAQLTGAVSTIKTAQFPIVRPHQQRNLKGDAIGSVENPLTLRLNGVVINEYNGTNQQAAGTYYRVTNYNLGYVQYVTELGVPVTPASTGNADDISYSYTTNITRFDLDNGATELDLHLNGLLRAVGERKSVLDGDRFVEPNFQLMSPSLNNTASNARAFEAQSKRNGADTSSDGDLEMIKGIPAFKTNAPGTDLGDERILMGQRGVLTYTIAKPFLTGTPFEAVDSNGNAIGKKQAYGEEYSAIKVPTPIRHRLTSVLAYSFSAR